MTTRTETPNVGRPCPDCRGRGDDQNSLEICERCQGVGVIEWEPAAVQAVHQGDIAAGMEELVLMLETLLPPRRERIATQIYCAQMSRTHVQTATSPAQLARLAIEQADILLAQLDKPRAVQS